MEKIEIKNTKYQKVFDSILQKRPDLTRNFLKIALRIVMITKKYVRRLI